MKQIPEQPKSAKNLLGEAGVALLLPLNISFALEKGTFADPEQSPVSTLTDLRNSLFQILEVNFPNSMELSHPLRFCCA